MEKASDLVSVIVPVFKVEAYLDECIGSIVEQTYSDLEIILIDDGSPDSCPQICDGWAEKDPRIVVVHRENGGVSRARNTGIEKANGRYVVFVDGDDFLEPRYIEYLYRALRDTGSDISECRYTRSAALSDNTSAPPAMSPPVLQNTEEALRIWAHPDQKELNLVCWNKMYPVGLVREIGFAEGHGGGEDVLFTCRVFGRCTKIARIDNELYHWRNTPGSASKQFPDNQYQTIELLLSSPDLLEKECPSALTMCKILMCKTMDGFFYGLISGTAPEDKDYAKEKMLSFRRRIRFTLKEWIKSSLRDKVIIICSNASLVGYYVRFRHFLGKLRG